MMVAQTAARQKARELALEQSAHIAWRRDGLKEQVRAAADRLHAYGQVLRQQGDLQSQPAEEWLLDHLDFIAQQGLMATRLLQAQKVRLPRLQGGRPRAYALCEAYLDCVESAMEPDSWTAFTNAYQEVSVLTQAELWALPVFMRAAQLIRLADVMGRVAARREAGQQVTRWLRAVAPAGKEPCPGALRQALEEAGDQLPMAGAILVQLVEQLREYTEDEAQLREWLSCRLESGVSDLDRLVSYEHRLQADLQVQTGHLITGLRTLDRLDWRPYFDALSHVEQALCREAADTYAHLDFASRNRMREQVAILAARLRVPEQLIAQQAVGLADEAWRESEDLPGIRERACFAAFYLLDPAGVRSLISALRTCSTPRRMAGALVMQNATGYYFATLVALFAAFILIALGWLHDDAPGRWGAPAWLVALVALCVLASEWAVVTAHWLIESKVAAKPLLRLDYSQGVAQDATTLVVIPVIWSTDEEVHALAERLEMHYLANRDPHIHFALLGDFTDAPSETMPTDQPLLETARQVIEELGQRYHGTGTTFHLFHRRRLFNESEAVWMGWERKRGKLVELVELLQGSLTTSYHVVVGPREVWSAIRYVITLDTDTQLPMGTAMRMIGTIALPYNAPRLNEDGTRVEQGYGVLQPRVGIKHEAVMRSRLAALWAGEPGIDPYAFAVSDPYQDALGQGIFTGKGIFDISTFAAVLCQRIPDNRVLSHDLLEGGFLRAGLLSDIEVIDDHPGTYTAFQARLHRWVRGDWQLLDWLRAKAPDRRGRSMPVMLCALTRWQIIDNLRRSLLTPVIFVVLLLGLAGLLPGLPGHYVVVVAATLCLPIIRHGLHLTRIWRKPTDLAIVAGQVLVTALLLPFATALLLDAIGRTLWRLYVSGRHLLEWVSSAQIDRQHSARRRRALLRAPFGYLLIVLFAAVVAWHVSNDDARMAGLLLCVVWAFAPAYVHLLDQPVIRPRPSLAPADRARLTTLAREIWDFFETYAGAQDHFLPPDNVQVEPDVGVAHRTSPTNIALLLASTVAACDLGFIDRAAMRERLSRTLATLEGLDKWNGHLYNWYDTRTLRPLPPLYVSTVDSGNLVAALIAVREAVLESDSVDGQLAQRLEALITQTDFRPLYDHRAQLFTLGYHVEIDQRETILYDLLASEARQASFVAIALGQVSVSHWFALGRTLVKAGRYATLLAWTGTMFEYFMPPLFMKMYRQTLWEQTYRGALWRQQQYALAHQVPWGISESGYYAFDYQMNYQYQAFGVPGLGFKRGLDQDLVIAPYATLLAFPFAPKEALENLGRLDEWGARGPYGYYEAIDCTRERMPKGQHRMVIKSFMAHHQGMSLVAIVNGLQDDVMVRRFHHDARVATAELLLQERAPVRPDLIAKPGVVGVRPTERPRERATPSPREYTQPDLTSPEICILSNGALTTVIDQVGGGYVRAQGLAVTRWREDRMAGDFGSYLYVRSVSLDAVWSASYAPCQQQSSRQRVQFGLDKATFMRVDGPIETLLEVCVSPEHNCELRRLTLTNTGPTEQILEITSFLELSLARPDADEAHPAFNKLFVETEFVAQEECLLARRRPRSKEEKPLYAAHALQLAGRSHGPFEYDTDRASFIGRGRDLRTAQGLQKHLSERVGAVLDPAFIARRRIVLEAGASAQLCALLATGDTREDVLSVLQRYTTAQQVDRAFKLAWTRSRIELRHEHMTDEEAALYQRMAGLAQSGGLMPDKRAQAIRDNVRGQSGLWAHGISGDVPVCLVMIADDADLSFVRKVARGQRYLRRLGIPQDLVILCDAAGGYRQDLRETIRRAVDSPATGGAGGIFVLGIDQLTSEDVHLIQSVARVTLLADGPSLASQLRRPRAPRGRETALVASSHRLLVTDMRANKEPGCPADEAAVAVTQQVLGVEPEQGDLYNGWGSFSEDGREYVISLRQDCHLPAPWANVLANAQFGCMVTELGTGYTWWRNSRECKLTPWRNDPVVDRPGEILYVVDQETGRCFSPMAAALREPEPYGITHGFGYTRYVHQSHGIWQEATVFVPVDDPVKVVRVRLRNDTGTPRTLSVAYYAEWVLGVKRDAAAACLVSTWDAGRQAIITRNGYQEVFREAHACLRIQRAGDTVDKSAPSEYVLERQAFFGPDYDLAQPASLRESSWRPSEMVSSDPCAAVRTHVALAAGQEVTLQILLGCASSQEATQALLDRYADTSLIDREFARLQDFWRHTTSQVQVQTPSRELNLLVNGWLLYQVLGCRMWARTAFYQAGGAFGFRDQLQDALALLHTRPDLTRSQILLHAAHQFVEGDVQHWWHEETQRGIRTRFSDDLLWLPYALARYVEQTGDTDILEQVVPFLADRPLETGEDERYAKTEVSAEVGTLYEHGKRAIYRSQEVGEHGLPLIGSGDWNDGLSLVGPQGRGESVWLGWFLCDVLARFAVLAQARGDLEFVTLCRSSHARLQAALDAHAWDGQWYRRAFTDGGQWLGSIHDAECRIDAIAQSWSAISGAAPEDKVKLAMRSFDRELVDRQLAIAKLLTPPFDVSDPTPGYIAGYPPGLRENGGQYTHGVIWGIIAWCLLEDGDRAFELFHMLSPQTHTATPGEVAQYAGEPYVMAADVYSLGPYKGRAGWTWYTGAAGWMYQAAVEWILGLRRRSGALMLQPCVPSDWQHLTVTYCVGQTRYKITMANPAGRTTPGAQSSLRIDGKQVEQTAPFAIDVCDDGAVHEVLLTL